jgi:hypothetical protein
VLRPPLRPPLLPTALPACPARTHHTQQLDEPGKGGAPFAEAVAARKPYYEKRIELFERYHAREQAAMEAAKAANEPLTVTLPDGATKPGVKGVTTPLDVAAAISKSLAKKVWDLFRPLGGDCALSLHTFDDTDGKEVGACAGVCVGRGRVPWSGAWRAGGQEGRCGVPGSSSMQPADPVVPAARDTHTHTHTRTHTHTDVLAQLCARAGPGA